MSATITRISTRSQQQLTTTTTTTTIIRPLIDTSHNDISTKSTTNISLRRSALGDLFDCVSVLSDSLLDDDNNNNTQSSNHITDEQRQQFKQVLEHAKTLALQRFIGDQFALDDDDAAAHDKQQNNLSATLQSTVDRYSASLRLLFSNDQSKPPQPLSSSSAQQQSSKSLVAKNTAPTIHKRTRQSKNEAGKNSGKNNSADNDNDDNDNDNDDDDDESTLSSTRSRKKIQLENNNNNQLQQKSSSVPSPRRRRETSNTSDNRTNNDDDDDDDKQLDIDKVMQEFVNQQPTPLDELLQQFVAKYKLAVDVEWLNNNDNAPQYSNKKLRILQSFGSIQSNEIDRELLTTFLDDTMNLLQRDISNSEATQRLVNFVNQVRSTENLNCAIQQLQLCHLTTKATKQNNDLLSLTSTSTATTRLDNENTMHQRMFDWDRANDRHRKSKQERWVTFVRLAISVAEFVHANYRHEHSFLELTLVSLNRARNDQHRRPMSYDVVKELYSLGNSLLQCDVLRQRMQDNNAIGNRRAWQKANREESFRLARPIIEYLLTNNYRWCESH